MRQDVMRNTQERRYFAPSEVVPVKNFQITQDDQKLAFQTMRKFGFDFNSGDIRRMMHAQDEWKRAVRERQFDDVSFAEDSGLFPTVTTPSIGTPVQFLQYWIPGFIGINTAPRNIDKWVGMTIAGDWEDEQIVKSGKELVGAPQPYGDYTNTPLAKVNINQFFRTVVRFEMGFQASILEGARSAKMNYDIATESRNSVTLQLEILRNLIGWFGYNNGSNLTYGLLNDPDLPNYVTFPNGALSSPLWSTKTFLEITKDIRLMIQALESQTLGLVNPREDALTLGLSVNVVNFLSVTSDFGNSVEDWLRGAYPKIKVEIAPEANNANGGANVAYLYADKIRDDISTDGGRVFDNFVQSKLRMLGVEQRVKGYIESFSNAMSGVMLNRPLGVVRYSGN